MSEPAPSSLSGWFTARVPGARAPLTLTRLTGGNSNLTYLVTDAGGRFWVLRRPPEGALLATAHDVLREARVLDALEHAPVPTPAVRARCEDPAVFGAAFFVMDWVQGTACTAAGVAATLSDRQRQTAGRSLADTLAALHAVDVDAIGLGSLGRREGYVHRQLRRWHAQWDAKRLPGLHEIDESFDLLEARVPEQRRVSLVHGDYRLDNCILGPDGQVRAVLDWEICALGDPLVDLGILLAYWAEPGDRVCALESPPTAVGGFGTREELCRRYLRASGLDESTDVSYYVAFAWWKLSCIVAGVAVRAAGRPGVAGARDVGSYLTQLHRLAATTLELARDL